MTVEEANIQRNLNTGTEINSNNVAISSKINDCVVDGSVASRHCHDPPHNSTHDTTKFDHVFSGWSVWLEPKITESLKQEMSYLEQACGGKECGVMPFVPHVTLLYNIHPFKLEGDFVPGSNETTTSVDSTANAFTSPLNPKKLLEQCWDELIQWRLKNDKNNLSGKLSEAEVNGEDYEEPGKSFSAETQSSSSGLFTNIPQQLAETSTTIQVYDWYYQHYRKSDDNGKGFGCCIAHLLIQPASWLEKLQRICCDAFGPDERMNFIPHISLVYAPESYGDFVRWHVLSRQQQQQREEEVLHKTTPKERSDRAQEEPIPIDECPSITGDSTSTTRVDLTCLDSANVTTCWWLEPQTVAYLSLWSTNGRIEDWYCITKVAVS